MGGLVSIEVRPQSTKCIARANVPGTHRAEAHADMFLRASDESCLFPRHPQAILTDHSDHVPTPTKVYYGSFGDR